MNSKSLWIVLAVVIIGGGIWWYSQSSSQPAPTDHASSDMSDMDMPASTPDTTAPTPSAQSTASAVSIQGFKFSPATINVKKGTKVTWTNNDSLTHQVTADNPSLANIASPQLLKGDKYSFTFAKAGTFTYHCALHPEMKATVHVTE